MTQSPPPERPPSSRRPLNFDDLIGILVAFASIGTIFFWAISRDRQGFELPLFERASAPQPTATPPWFGSSPEPRASVSAAPTTPPSPTAVSPVEQPTARPAPVPVPVPVQPASPAAAPQTTQFSDIPSGFWATPFLAELARRNVIEGTQDGAFQPDRPVTRAEFSRMLQQAFDQPKQREAAAFGDIPSGFWATDAINQAVQMGFMNGYPGNVFRPDQPIPKYQALIALATGLGLSVPPDPAPSLKSYRDADQLPRYAQGKVAAATSAGLVVNHPDVAALQPERAMTRADAAALIYQALVHSGKASKIDSAYIVPPQP